MVNPDGVVAGNYRTNLCGYDLNRRWNGGQKRRNLHEASMVKKYIHQIAKKRSVAFVLDLHGHSRKLFSFFYGNPSSGSLI
jgi:murein tripeptide amidase MpaA